jgi:hypothetical protein
MTGESGFWKTGWRGEKPANELIRRWFAAPYRSISACIRGGNQPRAIDQLPGWTGPARHPNAKLSYNVLATYPIVDSTNSHALILYSTASTVGIGGTTEFILLGRFRGTWRIIGTGFLRVS